MSVTAYCTKTNLHDVASPGLLTDCCVHFFFSLLCPNAQASMFGAGCSAYNATRDRSGAACSVSGTGEHIMERLLSFTVAQQLRQQTSEPAAASANRKRNALSHGGVGSKRRRADDAGAVAVDSDSETDSCDEAACEPTSSVEEVLRRALLDEQPAAYCALPGTAAGPRDAVPAGMIALQISPTSASSRWIELSWAHSTPHLGVGFMSREDPHPRAFISASEPLDEIARLALPAQSHQGPSIVVAGQRFRIGER